MDKKTQALVEQYAKSLVEVAIEKGTASEIQSETKALLTVFEQTSLNKMLTSIAVPRDKKVELTRLLQESCSVYLSNFLEVILQNERESLLYVILKAVGQEFAVATNQHDIHVTTAVQLTPEQKTRILDLVASKFGIKTGHLVETLDNSILGGFIINVNNKVIDTSIRRQLQAFKLNLK